MQKVDIIIAVVGVVALTATTLGVLYEEELVGATDIGFIEKERDITIASSASFTSNTEREVAVGINATSAVIDLEVQFDGTARQPQSGATISVTVTGPNGSTGAGINPKTMTFTPPPQTSPQNPYTAAPVQFTFTLDFGEVPMNTTSESPEDFDANQTWEGMYKIEISISSPVDSFTNGQLPAQLQSDYRYTASYSMTEKYFEHVIKTSVSEAGP